MNPAFSTPAIERIKHEATQTEEPQKHELTALTLAELRAPASDDPSILFKNRWLCRGGALEIIGPTGVGKSSLSMQAMIEWAVKRPAFHIEPMQALKSLLIQAENDHGDLCEMRDGILAGLGMEADEAEAATGNVLIHSCDDKTGPNFAREVVKPLLEKHRPDLLWIDPALSFLGADASDQEAVPAWLRHDLNPLLRKYGVACILLCHTGKPRTQASDSTSLPEIDPAYAQLGSSEWANWTRATLTLQRTKAAGLFCLTAGKRRERLWRDDEGAIQPSRLLAHSRIRGQICWRDADDADFERLDEVVKNDKRDEVAVKTAMERGMMIMQATSKTEGRTVAEIHRITGIPEGSLHRYLADLAGRFVRKDGKQWFQV